MNNDDLLENFPRHRPKCPTCRMNANVNRMEIQKLLAYNTLEVYITFLM